MMFSSRLDSSEQIIVTIRKHPLVFCLQILVLFFGALIPLVFTVLAPENVRLAFAGLFATGVFLVFAYVIWVLLLWMSAFVLWTNYFFDMWVVTNRRIIDIDQRTLFYREITTLMLEKIQDITVEIPGVLATLFGYGTLIIHTAGENKDIVIHFANNPQEAKDKILACQERAVQHRSDFV